jgi:hypothetical protein
MGGPENEAEGKQLGEAFRGQVGTCKCQRRQHHLHASSFTTLLCFATACPLKARDVARPFCSHAHPTSTGLHNLFFEAWLSAPSSDTLMHADENCVRLGRIGWQLWASVPAVI